MFEQLKDAATGVVNTWVMYPVKTIVKDTTNILDGRKIKRSWLRLVLTGATLIGVGCGLFIPGVPEAFEFLGKEAAPAVALAATGLSAGIMSYITKQGSRAYMWYYYSKGHVDERKYFFPEGLRTTNSGYLFSREQMQKIITCIGTRMGNEDTVAINVEQELGMLILDANDHRRPAEERQGLPERLRKLAKAALEGCRHGQADAWVVYKAEKKAWLAARKEAFNELIRRGFSEPGATAPAYSALRSRLAGHESSEVLALAQATSAEEFEVAKQHARKRITPPLSV